MLVVTPFSKRKLPVTDKVQMVVVPKVAQVDRKKNVALEFFLLTFGTVANGSAEPKRVLSAFMAISSFGNMVVMTFVAARGPFANI